MTELKVKTGFGGTKRKYGDYPGPFAGVMSSRQSLSRRVTRLTKQMKVSAPNHMYFSAVSGFSNWSTSGGLFDCCQAIIQGDAYPDRFGNKIMAKRVNLKFGLQPGSAQSVPSICRLTVVRAAANLVAGPTVSVSLNPIANTSILQTYHDEWFEVGPTIATVGYPTVVHRSIKVKTPIKFSGAGAGSVVGESIFVLWSSQQATGTSAPRFIDGIIEFFFQP